MKKHFLRILLAVSLAANVGFVVGFLHTHKVLRSLRTPEGRMQWAAKRLELDPRQRQAVKEIQREWSDHLRQVAHANRADLDAFWGEMIKDDRDSKKARAILDRLLVVQNEEMRLSVDVMKRTFAVLTPEQRRELVKVLRGPDRF